MLQDLHPTPRHWPLTLVNLVDTAELFNRCHKIGVRFTRRSSGCQCGQERHGDDDELHGFADWCWRVLLVVVGFVRLLVSCNSRYGEVNATLSIADAEYNLVHFVVVSAPERPRRSVTCVRRG
jgi:hypothetical protein